LYQEGYGKIPASGWKLALENFSHELRALRRSFRYDEWQEFEQNSPSDNIFTKAARGLAGRVVTGFSNFDKSLEDRGILSELTTDKTDREVQERGPENALTREMREKLSKLQLSVKGVTQREKRREALGKRVNVPWFVRAPYVVLCWLLDVVYPNRPIQRFWLLEEVARMPYFSYISMLHLYETLGWWRAGADLRKVHFAEEWNEMHHLQIMESLGGDALWVDRFIAAHSAIVYYFLLLLLFFWDPEAAYSFSELLESHAVDTYGEFVDVNEELLKDMPPPLVALQYYKGDDLYMFDEFQTTKRVKPRRPACRNLHDVFINIRDDEGEHVTTMRACRNGDIYRELKHQD
jgi:ubiquinol oxidase